MKKYVDRQENLFCKKETAIKEIIKDNFFKALIYEIGLKDKK